MDELLHLAWRHPDAARFIFVLGLVLAISAYDRLHLRTGSLIVPAYVALHALEPAAIALSVINALIVYGLVYHMLPRYVLLSGPAKFAALIPISITLHILGSRAVELSGLAHDLDPLLWNVGFVAPGLIAHDIAAQGFRNTFGSIAAIGGIIVAVNALIGTMLPRPDAMATLIPTTALSFDLHLLHFAVLASVLASVMLTRNFGWRAGGFVGAAYVSMLVVHPAEIIWCAVLSVVTYLVVTRLLTPHMIMFGRRKFGAMLLVGAVLSWGGLLGRQVLLGGEPFPLSSPSLSVVGITLTGLFANDMERVGITRVVKGTALASLITLSASLFIAQVSTQGSTLTILALALLTAATAAAVCGPQLRWLLNRAAWAAEAWWRSLPCAAAAPLCVRSAGPHVAQGRLERSLFVVLLLVCTTLLAMRLGLVGNLQQKAQLHRIRAAAPQDTLNVLVSGPHQPRSGGPGASLDQSHRSSTVTHRPAASAMETTVSFAGESSRWKRVSWKKSNSSG